MERKKRWLAAGIVVGSLCVIAAIFVTIRLYQERKETEAKIAARRHGQSGVSLDFQSDTVTYQGKTYRRNSYMKAILCMGVDREGTMLDTTVHTFGGQADGIFLIAQDTARNNLKILMVPRDTMTEITMTDLSGNELGKEVQHLTLAYAYGDGREKSCELVAEAVSGLLGGLKIDHYVSANINVINILNDKVGGVTVTVPEVTGLTEREPEFVAGQTVTLHGDQAETFVRYRDINEIHSAIYRMERQQEYITQFFATVKRQSDVNSGIVTDLLDEVEDYMVTDMGKEEYLKVAMDALELNRLDDENFCTIPGEAIMSDRYDEFYPNEEELTPLILELFYREIS